MLSSPKRQNGLRELVQKSFVLYNQRLHTLFFFFSKNTFVPFFPPLFLSNSFFKSMADSLSSGVSQALQVYTKGTKAWFEDEDEAWVSATVVSKEETDTGVKIIFEDDKDSGRVCVCEIVC